MTPLDGDESGGGGGSTGMTTGAAASGSRLWLGLRDPRIVRVSRALGGKDRHSKVSTVKGLRDRRVRLSVPTAIQLYDLQDRLGLSQPSKVVDWLLAAAQDEIDKLPPLPIPASGLAHGASCAMGIYTHPPATALCIANSGGGDMGYADGALGHLADGEFASACFSGSEPGSNSRVFFPHGGEAAAPLSLLPGGMGQYLFCAPGGMAAASVYGPSTTYAATVGIGQANSMPDNAFAGDFNSLLKSSFSGKSQNK